MYWYNQGVGAVDLATAHLAGLLGHAQAQQPYPAHMLLGQTPLAQSLARYLNPNAAALAMQGVPMPMQPHPQMPPVDPRASMLMQAVELKKLPQIPLGLDSGAVLASTAFSKGTTPATPFRVTAIEGDPSVSQFFSLSRISIGLTEIIAGSDSISATAYDPDASSPPIDADDLFPGVQLTMAGTNEDTAATHRIRFTVWGVNLNPRRC